MPLREKVLTGSAYGLGSQAAIFCFRLVSGLLLARLLSRRDFGIVAISMVIIDLAQIVQGMGLGRAVIQRGTEEKSFLHTAFVLQLALSSALALICATVIAPLWGTLYKEPQTTETLWDAMYEADPDFRRMDEDRLEEFGMDE